jgi:hypothetical protein
MAFPVQERKLLELVCPDLEAGPRVRTDLTEVPSFLEVFLKEDSISRRTFLEIAALASFLLLFPGCVPKEGASLPGFISEEDWQQLDLAEKKEALLNRRFPRWWGFSEGSGNQLDRERLESIADEVVGLLPVFCDYGMPCKNQYFLRSLIQVTFTEQEFRQALTVLGFPEEKIDQEIIFQSGGVFGPYDRTRTMILRLDDEISFYEEVIRGTDNIFEKNLALADFIETVLVGFTHELIHLTTPYHPLTQPEGEIVAGWLNELPLSYRGQEVWVENAFGNLGPRLFVVGEQAGSQGDYELFGNLKEAEIAMLQLFILGRAIDDRKRAEEIIGHGHSREFYLPIGHLFESTLGKIGIQVSDWYYQRNTSHFPELVNWVKVRGEARGYSWGQVEVLRLFFLLDEAVGKVFDLPEEISHRLSLAKINRVVARATRTIDRFLERLEDR